jgi:hypothetical protein
MRTHLKMAIPFLLMFAFNGCARENPVSPSHMAAATGSSSLAHASGGLLPAQVSTGPNAVVVWNRLTTELGVGAKLPPPLFARA